MCGQKGVWDQQVNVSRVYVWASDEWTYGVRAERINKSRVGGQAPDEQMEWSTGGADRWTSGKWRAEGRRVKEAGLHMDVEWQRGIRRVNII